MYHRNAATAESESTQDATAVLKIPGSADNFEQTQASRTSREESLQDSWAGHTGLVLWQRVKRFFA